MADTTLQTIGTVISTALGAIALWKAFTSGKEAVQAKIDAAEAKARADDAEKRADAAVAQATRSADALHGLRAVEERKLALEEQQRELEQAQAEGERILLDWMNRAWQRGHEYDALTRHVSQWHEYKHPRIENLAELCAAQRALNHKSVRAMSTALPKIGEPFEIHVYNPRAA